MNWKKKRYSIIDPKNLKEGDKVKISFNKATPYYCRIIEVTENGVWFNFYKEREMVKVYAEYISYSISSLSEEDTVITPY